MMALTYASKAEVKRCIADGTATTARLVETSLHGNEYTGDGEYTVVGPAPTRRVWYGEITCSGGKIVAIK